MGLFGLRVEMVSGNIDLETSQYNVNKGECDIIFA